MNEIRLEDYYTDTAIKTIKKETLLKAINKLPIKLCPECGCRLKSRTSTGLTKTYCSKKCANNSQNSKDKKTKTNIEIYGNECSLHNIDIKQKYINTNIKKYGFDNPIKSNIIKNKIKETNINRYGVENPLGNKIIQNKVKNTIIEKYGVDHIGKSNEIKNKIKETNINRYGTSCSAQNKDIQKKIIKTKLDNIINKQDYKGILTSNNTSYEYKCNICNKTSKYKTKKERDFILQRFRFGTIPCSYCYPREKQGINQRSSIEIKLEQSIKDLGIKTEHRKDIDIYLPDYSIGIEVNGTYWHSDKFKDKNSHKNKILRLKEEGIQILCFTDLELNEKYETILNYIKGKLNIIPSIGASKCKIKEILYIEAKEFCNQYHIHGIAIGSKNYGLYYKNELVSVCVVGLNRFEKNNKTVEIIRLCNKCKIIGGFNRFMKLIKNDFPNKEITTFINAYLGLSDNNIFTKSGFKFISHTEPNYFWLLNKVKISRQQSQKHKLLKLYPDSKGTEDDIMYGLGAKKVYDAGNYKFLYK